MYTYIHVLINIDFNLQVFDLPDPNPARPHLESDSDLDESFIFAEVEDSDSQEQNLGIAEINRFTELTSGPKLNFAKLKKLDPSRLPKDFMAKLIYRFYSESYGKENPTTFILYGKENFKYEILRHGKPLSVKQYSKFKKHIENIIKNLNQGNITVFVAGAEKPPFNIQLHFNVKYAHA